ncbi:MAG: hypothetical protein LBC78_00390 [Oscillospiraceae bacterium]|nr:hypothetical protein [Oscillospiraceae bacterium]
MSQLETEIARLTLDREAYATDFVKLMELDALGARLGAALEEKIEQWIELA